MTGRRATPTTLATVWLTGAVVFFVFEAIAAKSVPYPYTYNYARDWISQLVVPAWTPLAAVMNVGLCVQGAAFLLGAILAGRATTTGHRRLFVVLAGLYAVGVIMVAAVPAVVGAPPSKLFVLHGVGALLAIVGGNAAIITGSLVVAGLVGGRWYRKTSVAMALLGFASWVVLGQPAAQPTLGIWERGSVYSVMVWQILSAVLLFAGRRTSSPRVDAAHL